MLPDVRTGTPVTSVKSLGAEGPVQLTAADGAAEYDGVVLATHSDVSLKILGEQGPQASRPLRHAFTARSCEPQQPVCCLL